MIEALHWEEKKMTEHEVLESVYAGDHGRKVFMSIFSKP